MTKNWLGGNEPTNRLPSVEGIPHSRSNRIPDRRMSCPLTYGTCPWTSVRLWLRNTDAVGNVNCARVLAAFGVQERHAESRDGCATLLAMISEAEGMAKKYPGQDPAKKLNPKRPRIVSPRDDRNFRERGPAPKPNAINRRKRRDG